MTSSETFEYLSKIQAYSDESLTKETVTQIWFHGYHKDKQDHPSKMKIAFLRGEWKRRDNPKGFERAYLSVAEDLLGTSI